MEKKKRKKVRPAIRTATKKDSQGLIARRLSEKYKRFGDVRRTGDATKHTIHDRLQDNTKRTP
jgi:DNA-binding HxlR family transcriptional regulator